MHRVFHGVAGALLILVLVVACEHSSGTPSAGPESDAGPLVDAEAGGAASLATLITTSPLPLTPAFAPDIHDYYVRCAAGTNALSVSATAADGATVALTQPVTTAPASSQAATVALFENQAIVVSASSGSETAEYWVRCLPYDFPQLAMNAHPEVGVPTPGYYLLGDTDLATGESSYAMVVDGNGVPVWYSKTSNGNQPVNVESLQPNVVSFVAYLYYTFAATSWKYEVHDIATNGGVTFVAPVGEPLDQHELQLLPNGDYLFISDPIVTGVDLTGLESFGSDEAIIGCNIQEVSPSGAIVWQWTATDHFDPVKDSTFPEIANVSSVNVVDPFHCNSIDVAADGDLLVSSRHMDSVFLVSKATGAVVWKMGGATYTKDDAPYLAVTNDPQTSFYRQHDARFLPNGQISLFDDQTDTSGVARGVVYSYDVAAGTATFVWQYLGGASSSAMGSFRILSDGSRVIGWGEGNIPGLAFTEVDSSGNDLLDFNFTDGDESYRALKVPLTQLDLGLMHSSVTNLVPDDAGVIDSDDAAVPDATAPVEAGEGGEAAEGCFAISGSGASAQCHYTSSNPDGLSCAAIGAAPGSCPSSGLYGCCVETEPVDGGPTQVSALCYYSYAAGQPAASDCAFQAYEGMPFDWQTYAP